MARATLGGRFGSRSGSRGSETAERPTDREGRGAAPPSEAPGILTTRTLTIDPAAPEPAALEEAARVLLAGRLVAFPTETFYGLGANALDPVAVARVFAAKGRPPEKPLLVLVDSVAMAERLVAEVPPRARRLMARYWPGPLTLVLRAAAGVPAALTAGTGTLGLRIPSHPLALALVRAAGVPVTAPSANPSGAASPREAKEVLAGLAGRIELVLDGGPTPGGAPSTILDLTTAPPRVLREGAVRLAPEEL